MGSKLWRVLTKPWLGGLLADVRLCRAACAFAAVVGVGSFLGISLMPCPFRWVTGLPCPGCGMTRAFLSLMQGHWSLAIQYHLFAPFFMLIGLLVVLASIIPATARMKLSNAISLFEGATALPALFLLLFAIYGLIRVGYFCFDSPRPTPSPVRALMSARAPEK